MSLALVARGAWFSSMSKVGEEENAWLGSSLLIVIVYVRVDSCQQRFKAIEEAFELRYHLGSPLGNCKSGFIGHSLYCSS